MPILYEDECARLSEHCRVEDAEVLLAWLLDHPGAALDVSECTHLHAAVLQTILAARGHPLTLPTHSFLAGCLASQRFDQETQAS